MHGWPTEDGPPGREAASRLVIGREAGPAWDPGPRPGRVTCVVGGLVVEAQITSHGGCTMFGFNRRRLDDARASVRRAMHATEALDTAELRDAAVALMEGLERVERDLERAQSKLSAKYHAAAIPGDRIVLRRNSGGYRHYLNNRPISAGSGLYLKAQSGWVPGRYESRYPQGYFYFDLTTDHEMCLEITDTMSFLWPAELPDILR